MAQVYELATNSVRILYVKLVFVKAEMGSGRNGEMAEMGSATILLYDVDDEI